MFTRAKAPVRTRLKVSSKASWQHKIQACTQGSQEAVSDYVIRFEKIPGGLWSRSHGQGDQKCPPLCPVTRRPQVCSDESSCSFWNPSVSGTLTLLLGIKSVTLEKMTTVPLGEYT